MDAKKSKFDFEHFCGESDYCFAVNHGKYTKEEAEKIYRQETDYDGDIKIDIANVRWQAGTDDDGNKYVGWWLIQNKDEGKRLCKVWAFAPC